MYEEGYVMSRPDSQGEKARLDLQHEIWLLTLNGRLHTSPLPDDLKSVLDVGTGTGSWAIAMAKALPHVQIVATDLTPPLHNETLPNLQFLKNDADLAWPAGEFDFVHGRMLSSGIHDWPGFLTKAWEHLRPGGWLELLDVSHPFRAQDAEADRPDASPFIHFGQLANKAWARAGLDYYATTKHVERLKKLGFVDIVEHELRWPLGEWAPLESEKRQGSLALVNFVNFLDSAGVSILSYDNFMGQDEAETSVKDAKMDLQENCMTKRFYLTMKVCVAMKRQ